MHGRHFVLYGDYQVGEPVERYAAVGCGDELALGALHATARLDLKPRARLTAALRVADHHSGGVAAPYTYAKTPR